MSSEEMEDSDEDFDIKLVEDSFKLPIFSFKYPCNLCGETKEIAHYFNYTHEVIEPTSEESGKEFIVGTIRCLFCGVKLKLIHIKPYKHKVIRA